MNANGRNPMPGAFKEAGRVPECWPADMKKTKQRICIFKVLKKATEPLSAADIFARTGREAGSLSTVYRILEQFTQKGVATRIAFLDGGAAMYELDHHEHRHYAVCTVCHKIIAVKNCPMESYIPDVKEDDFHVIGHTLELQGICAKCYKNHS